MFEMSSRHELNLLFKALYISPFVYSLLDSSLFFFEILNISLYSISKIRNENKEMIKESLKRFIW
jgi:hypothetical protein